MFWAIGKFADEDLARRAYLCARVVLDNWMPELPEPRLDFGITYAGIAVIIEVPRQLKEIGHLLFKLGAKNVCWMWVPDDAPPQGLGEQQEREEPSEALIQQLLPLTKGLEAQEYQWYWKRW
ncbi:MAG: hypothetical protein QXT16_08810 [Candidatus Caldarchaeum sp.]